MNKDLNNGLIFVAGLSIGVGLLLYLFTRPVWLCNVCGDAKAPKGPCTNY